VTWWSCLSPVTFNAYTWLLFWGLDSIWFVKQNLLSNSLACRTTSFLGLRLCTSCTFVWAAWTQQNDLSLESLLETDFLRKVKRILFCLLGPTFFCLKTSLFLGISSRSKSILFETFGPLSVILVIDFLGTYLLFHNSFEMWGTKSSSHSIDSDSVSER
jgi:hypothetical protein